MESRGAAPTGKPQGTIALTVNGSNTSPWLKSGLQTGDTLLISRPLGTGVLFAGSMTGATSAPDLDSAMQAIPPTHPPQTGETNRGAIHACTDITGFGLLGHLGEMLQNNPRIRIQLDGSAIPAYKGALELFERGVSSTLAPSNRAAWRWLEGPVQLQEQPSAALLELLIDPQTCGPLLLGCTTAAAEYLTRTGPWIQIGNTTAINE